MLEQKKQTISIRLGESDLRNVKRIAKRLGVRGSDIIRFSIKSMLERTSPLCDEAIAGRNLLPVLLEFGDELIRYFELDAYRLETIINEHAEGSFRVDSSDIALLAMSSLREQYLMLRIGDSRGTAAEKPPSAGTLRSYLYEKYMHRGGDAKRSEVMPPVDAEAFAGAHSIPA